MLGSDAGVSAREVALKTTVETVKAIPNMILNIIYFLYINDFVTHSTSPIDRKPSMRICNIDCLFFMLLLFPVLLASSSSCFKLFLFNYRLV